MSEDTGGESGGSADGNGQFMQLEDIFDCIYALACKDAIADGHQKAGFELKSAFFAKLFSGVKNSKEDAVSTVKGAAVTTDFLGTPHADVIPEESPVDPQTLSSVVKDVTTNIQAALTSFVKHLHMMRQLSWMAINDTLSAFLCVNAPLCLRCVLFQLSNIYFPSHLSPSTILLTILGDIT